MSLVPSSEFGAAICVRVGIARVSVDFARHWVVRFSLLVGWTVRACGYVEFLPKSFVGFALTAVEAFVLAENGLKYQIISSPNRTNAFYNMAPPSQFGEMDLHPTKLEQFSRSAVIQKTCVKDTQTASFFHPIMKNVRYNAQQNLLKREQSKPEHKAPNPHVEVAMIVLHRTPES